MYQIKYRSSIRWKLLRIECGEKADHLAGWRSLLVPVAEFDASASILAANCGEYNCIKHYSIGFAVSYLKSNLRATLRGLGYGVKYKVVLHEPGISGQCYL